MANLLARIIASFAAAEPVPSLDPLDSEFNQYVGAAGVFNGGSTDKKLLTRSNDANDPPYDLDQLGAGLLARWKQSGTMKARVNNNGQIETVHQFKSTLPDGTPPLDVVSETMVEHLNAEFVGDEPVSNLAKLDTHKTTWAAAWRVEDPSTYPLTDNGIAQTVFIVPGGGSLTALELRASYSGGSHAPGGSVTFRLVRRVAGSDWQTPSALQTVSLDNANDTKHRVYTVALSQALSAGDTLSVEISARSGTVSERGVSIEVTGKQALIT